MKLVMPMPLRRLVNAFPDVNAHPAEQQATLGLVISVMLHMLVFALWLSAQSGWLDDLLLAPKKPPAPLDLLVQVVEPPVVQEKVVVPLDQLKEPPRVDSTGLKESATEKTSGLFQSDKNLDAGSELKPTGNAPVPTLKGRLSDAEKTLVKQDAKVGVLDAMQSAKPPAALSKLANPQAGGKAAVAAKKPSPKYQSGEDLPRMEDLPELNGELVFRRLASGPSTSSKSGGTAGDEPAQQAPAPKNPSESESIDDLFQEGKEKSESKGALAQNGKLGVDAIKTLMGDYQKSVGKMVGVPWNKLVKERMDTLESGLVKVHLWIAADGTLRKATVERTTSNKAFSDLCLEAVRKARLAPLPVELQATLRDGVLEMFYTFNLY